MIEPARQDEKRATARVLRDAVLWTAPQHEDRLTSNQLNLPHAEERREATRLEARNTPSKAFFWINLAQRRALRP